MLANTGGGGGGGHTAAKTSHAHAVSYAAHPYVQAAQAAISSHAAAHVAHVVAQHSAQHHAAHGGGFHLPHVGHASMHDPAAQFLAQALAHEVHQTMVHPQYPQGTPLTWNGSQWVPSHAGPGQMQGPQQAPPGVPQPDYGTSITTDNGGGGFMSLLMQAMGQ